MDVAWKILLEFLLFKRSMTLRVAIGEGADAGKLCLQDDSSPLDTKRLKLWHHLSACPSQDKVQLVEDAIAASDAMTIRNNVRTLIHILVAKIRIVTQDEGMPLSTHLVWFSGLYNKEHQFLCTNGPHAHYAMGMTVVITVCESVAEWLPHTFLFCPQLTQDTRLWAEEGRQLKTAVHSIFTPKKFDINLIGAGSPETPVPRNDAENNVVCCACAERFPMSLIVFLDSCTHTVCVGCAALCAKKHVSACWATTHNMPCPAEGCDQHMKAAEVACLMSHDDYAYLEVNEVRQALSENCATCPKCSCTYERISSGCSDNDPLKDKVVCQTCSTSFCIKCSTTPFHEGKPCPSTSTGPKCRYCGKPAVSTDPCVCQSTECREKGQRCCFISKTCGHLCQGTSGEKSCVSCLHPDCPEKHQQQTADDLCIICFVETLEEAPCLQLTCGHVFHAHCLENKLRSRWPTARITFSFMQCPICCEQIQHHLLSLHIAPINKIKDNLEARYMDRLRMEKLMNSDAITSEESPFYNDPLRFARENLCYFMCFKCERPYFGGLKRCMDIEREDPPRDELICGGCSAGSATCGEHGTQYIEYKCKYCCNAAVWYCWGTTHFCDLCHSPPRKTVREECKGEELCPIGGMHPPSGVEFAIGCAICRSKNKK